MHVAILIIDIEMGYMNIDTMKSLLELVILMCNWNRLPHSSTLTWGIATFEHTNWINLHVQAL